MSERQGSPGERAATAGRCVVLSPAVAAEEARSLLAALHRRGLSVALVHDTPHAMLEVVRQAAIALIVTDPARIHGADTLVDAVRACRPRTVCWQFEDRRLTPINGHLAGNPLAWAQRARHDHERLSGLVVQAQPRAPIPGEPLVSEEELAMLLGPMPDEPATA